MFWLVPAFSECRSYGVGETQEMTVSLQIFRSPGAEA